MNTTWAKPTYMLWSVVVSLAGGTVAAECDNCLTTDFVLLRYDGWGWPDAGFGNGGLVRTDFGVGPDDARGLALQADGKIVLAGRVAVSAAQLPQVGLARYLPDGRLDPEFGSNGRAVGQFVGARGGDANAVALDSAGRLVIAGDAWTGAGKELLVARFVGTGGPAPTWTPAVSPTACPRGFFRDVSASDYFYAAVSQLATWRVISGYGDCTFRPYAFMTRGQFAKVAGVFPLGSTKKSGVLGYREFLMQLFGCKRQPFVSLF